MLTLNEESFFEFKKLYIIYDYERLRKQNKKINFYIYALKGFFFNNTSEQKCLNDNFIDIV